MSGGGREWKPPEPVILYANVVIPKPCYDAIKRLSITTVKYAEYMADAIESFSKALEPAMNRDDADDDAFFLPLAGARAVLHSALAYFYALCRESNDHETCISMIKLVGVCMAADGVSYIETVAKEFTRRYGDGPVEGAYDKYMEMARDVGAPARGGGQG